MSSEGDFEAGLRKIYESSHVQGVASEAKTRQILSSALDQALVERSTTRSVVSPYASSEDDEQAQDAPAQDGPAQDAPAQDGPARGTSVGPFWWWGIPVAAAAVVLFVFYALPNVPTRQAEVPRAEGTITELQQAEVEWIAQERTLLLHSGAVRVEVEPTGGSEYRVRTDQFEVVVTGTVFDVYQDEVKVLRGSVRVQRHGENGESGEVLAVLSAGESWSDREATTATSTTSVVEEPSPPVVSKKPGVGANATELLELAQEHIRQGRAGPARKLLEQVLATERSEQVRARAKLLLADVSQLEGQPAAAERLYQRSADDEVDDGQAQAALFAAARLAAQRGETRKAHDLFLKYVKDYPNGPLRREAQRRLRELEAR